MASNNHRVLVTGGGTFLGDNIAAALLAEGAEVVLLVRPGAEDKLGPLAQRARWWTADVWDPASLRGRARGCTSVVNTVGSISVDPSQGLDYHRLNFVSARNIANMCVSDGVSHIVLLSSVRAPWINGQYIRAKREAESYLTRVGLKPNIIRAPVAYVRGRSRHPFYVLMTALGSLPPLSWTLFGRIAPMPVDMLARGVARITLERRLDKRIFYANELRKRNTPQEVRRALPFVPGEDSLRQRQPSAFELLDENIPFGWTPPSVNDDDEY